MILHINNLRVIIKFGPLYDVAFFTEEFAGLPMPFLRMGVGGPCLDYWRALY